MELNCDSQTRKSSSGPELREPQRKPPVPADRIPSSGVRVDPSLSTVLCKRARVRISFSSSFQGAASPPASCISGIGPKPRSSKTFLHDTELQSAFSRSPAPRWRRSTFGSPLHIVPGDKLPTGSSLSVLASLLWSCSFPAIKALLANGEECRPREAQADCLEFVFPFSCSFGVPSSRLHI
ncbi:hypothetical protein TGPRC2_359590 [Toxoplasma gondii TgCatPRC2]|uniref:Uncharacterized protein n=9 Tax=Toxoplasma gondii TaxID=5811 RepID=S7V1X6_TOXGG|nr:hypothetical protein TGGT1_359590 [Toxoplasma gondii GT1]KFG30081.1 hypothetical protein TGDOM2_359590 [Toxoplasma gondii GAB2-2007-GAL-DOM2]KFG36944.1 hypothetical protein TGFOU_359590 [Toxoplasma gondii FOU]KFG57541.1 hypothetical protein TGRUB_359590 [Toxoplasma gondii RUB]KFH02765.1 hypothetical protein TGMAS_359590 [Toxoplasma gondii MAS]KFH02970.1 hypothetical protein TGVAND_359590 [Toxoplasma gondii VAND]KYK67741.1 hypothetical protein TGPRC2_359590 [Toxoplasma gondii TgCatPRC2]PUA